VLNSPYLIQKKIRNQLKEGLSTLSDIIRHFAESIFNGLKIIWNGIIKPTIKYVALLIKQMAPYFLIIFGVLIDKVSEYLSGAVKLAPR